MRSGSGLIVLGHSISAEASQAVVVARSTVYCHNACLNLRQQCFRQP